MEKKVEKSINWRHSYFPLSSHYSFDILCFPNFLICSSPHLIIHCRYYFSSRLILISPSIFVFLPRYSFYPFFSSFSSPFPLLWIIFFYSHTFYSPLLILFFYLRCIRLIQFLEYTKLFPYY